MSECSEKELLPDPLIKSNAWLEICEIRERRFNLLKRREETKKERHQLLVSVLGSADALPKECKDLYKPVTLSQKVPTTPLTLDQELELMKILLKPSMKLPQTCIQLTKSVNKLFADVLHESVICTLEKLHCQTLINFNESQASVDFVDNYTLSNIVKYRDEKEYMKIKSVSEIQAQCRKRKMREVFPDIPPKTPRHGYRFYWQNLAKDLVSQLSFREQQHKDHVNDLHDLLTAPTAKDRMNAEMFRSEETRIIEFCNYLTRYECRTARYRSRQELSCRKLHYRPVKNICTEKKLGDCSFLNTCFHMKSCKYVHYELDLSRSEMSKFLERDSLNVARGVPDKSIILYPPQWIQCDIRAFDMPCLGKFSVIMADPPWDIHMELPYGTMSDREMVGLPIPDLSDEGFIFLWVTGRAMEVGRECLKAWGYRRCEDLIWVKINQLGKLIRTGRTGHWINHGKEHCLVGIKGNPKWHTMCIDTDVLISEVRETSHKPDEIYGLVERLSPGTRKLELFGRMHNTRPNWVTLGNQVDGVRLLDPDIARGFKKVYPDGNAMLRRARKYPIKS